MSTPNPKTSTRREFRNINAFTDLTTYRMTPAAWVSILHRASGGIMFLMLPFVFWSFTASLKSEMSFDALTAVFQNGILGVVVKLVTLALVWGYLHHLSAGVRHLCMDYNHDMATNAFGKISAQFVLVVSLFLTVAFAFKLFGLY